MMSRKVILRGFTVVLVVIFVATPLLLLSSQGDQLFTPHSNGAVKVSQINFILSWWQIITCTFSMVGLFLIQNSVRRHGNVQDKGWVYLGLSIAAWGGVGLVRLFYGGQAPRVESVLSIINSYFILLALPWFKYIPMWLGRLISLKSKINDQSNRAPDTDSVFEVYMSLFAILALASTLKNPANPFPPDVLFGTFTVIALTAVLYKTFQEREKIGLSYLAGFSLAVTFAAQVLKLFPESELWRSILSASFKTMLVILFFSLVLTWAEEITNRLSPEKVFLRLLSFGKIASGQMEYKKAVVVTIPGYLESSLIEYDPGTFTNLHKLISAARDEKNSDGFIKFTTSLPTESEQGQETNEITDEDEVSLMDTGEEVDAVETADEVVSAIVQPIIDQLLPELLEQVGKKGIKPLDMLKDLMLEKDAEGKLRLRVPADNIDEGLYDKVPESAESGEGIYLTLIPGSMVTSRQSGSFAIVTIPGYTFREMVFFSDAVFQRLLNACYKLASNDDNGCMLKGKDYGQAASMRMIVQTIARAVCSSPDEERELTKALWPKFFKSAIKHNKTNRSGLFLGIPLENITIIGTGEVDSDALRSALKGYQIQNESAA